MAGQRAGVAATVTTNKQLLSAAAGGFGAGKTGGGELGDDVGNVVEAGVFEVHEGLVVVVIVFVEGGEGRDVVAAVELGVGALDVACPFVGDVGLELGGFGGGRAVGEEDASAEGERVVGVVFFGEGREEVGKGFLVDVRELVLGL